MNYPFRFDIAQDGDLVIVNKAGRLRPSVQSRVLAAAGAEAEGVTQRCRRSSSCSAPGHFGSSSSIDPL
jgi:hypothetical protein